MSFDLLNNFGEEMTFNNSGRRYLLEFAAAHGFEWPKQEDGEDVEHLTSEQARGLADAIERGMGAGTDTEIAARVSDELTRLLVIPSDSPNFRQDPIKMTARSVEYLREFAGYARRGGFSVSF